MGAAGTKTPRTEKQLVNTPRPRQNETSKPIPRGTISRKGFPEPSPPRTSTKEYLKGMDFTGMDDVALNVPADLLLQGFWELVEYMVVTPDGKVVPDIMKVRSIFTWMMSYDMFSIDTDIIPPDESPLEYMMNIQCDMGDHAHLLYLLCSLADIPCVIINGMTKSEFYETGGSLDREKMASQWNAVYIDGSWRFIDCFWASVCVDARLPKDFITMNKKGDIKRLRSGEMTESSFNEFYFLVDPEQLIWTHFPDDERWQLLKIPVPEETFKNRLYIREQFHLMEFSFPPGSSENGRFTSYEGEPVEIKFLMPSRRSVFYKFAYVLDQIKKEAQENTQMNVLLERFVLLEHTEEYVKFIIRFPFSGQYQLDIYASDQVVSKEYKLLCTYCIDCIEIISDAEIPLPDNPDVGWGCSPLAIDAGITLIKPKEGAIIHTKTGLIELTFAIDHIGSLTHVLKSCFLDDAKLSQFVLTRRDKNKYIVQIRLPREGEYALKIFVDDAKYAKDYMPRDLVNYFFVFEGNKENPPFPHIAGGSVGTKPYAERFGVEVLSYPNGMVKAWGGRSRLEFETHTENISLTCDMCGFNRESNVRMSAIPKHFEDHWVFDIDLPLQGEYSVNVYAMLNDEPQTLYDIQSYYITSIVQNERRVKFVDDKEQDDIITASIRTAEEMIVIPIPQAEESEIIYTKIQRQDGKDDHEGNRQTVKNLGESFEISVKEEGEYDMDVWVQDEEKILEKVAKFTISRRHSFDSYTDDIEALIEMLKPKEKEYMANGDDRGEENVYDDYDDHCEDDSENYKENGEDSLDEEDSDVGKIDDNDDDENGELDKEIQEGLKQEVTINGFDQMQDDKMSAINEESEYEGISERDHTHSVMSEDSRRISTADIVISSVYTANHTPATVNNNKTGRSYSPEVHTDDASTVQDEQIDTVHENNIDVVFQPNNKKDEEMLQNKLNESDRAASRALESSASLMNVDLDNVKNEDLKARLKEARRRLIVSKLRKAIKEKRLNDLTTYYAAYKQLAPIGDDDIRREAKKIMNNLRAKEKLVEATLSKDPLMLRDAIIRAQKQNHNMSLTVQICLANRILERLNREKKISSMVLEMNQNAVTEMKKYQKPPDGVHQSLAATCLLLGEKPSVLKEWKSCQKLLYKVGKDSVTRRIAQFDPKDADMKTAQAAEKILGTHDVVHIRDVSKGAAAFFAWTKNMIKEIESFHVIREQNRSGKSGRHHYPRSATMSVQQN